MPQFTSLIQKYGRGLAIVAVVAGTAQFLSEHYGAPAMLMALLIGMSLHFLSEEEPTRHGIEFASKGILRAGVALLGLRIGFADIANLGATLVLEIVLLVFLVIAVGMFSARLVGRSWHYGALTGGAVAICGASAALAISAVLPKSKITEQDTLLTVIAVTTLSTMAMVLYPVLFSGLGLNDTQTGFLIGATIHDVAQVVGAGYSVSETSGDTATVVKLLRVAMLPVVLIALALAQRKSEGASIHLPWFLVVFIALMLLGNFVSLPPALLSFASDLSRTFLVIAVAGLGIKTSLGELRSVGGTKLILIFSETVFLLAAAVGLLMLTR
ncbi:MAG: YeiH family protein [Notoacmeibacter sp.]